MSVNSGSRAAWIWGVPVAAILFFVSVYSAFLIGLDEGQSRAAATNAPVSKSCSIRVQDAFVLGGSDALTAAAPSQGKEDP
jgi:hypothetical protein